MSKIIVKLETNELLQFRFNKSVKLDFYSKILEKKIKKKKRILYHDIWVEVYKFTNVRGLDT